MVVSIIILVSFEFGLFEHVGNATKPALSRASNSPLRLFGCVVFQAKLCSGAAANFYCTVSEILLVTTIPSRILTGLLRSKANFFFSERRRKMDLSYFAESLSIALAEEESDLVHPSLACFST